MHVYEDVLLKKNTHKVRVCEDVLLKNSTQCVYVKMYSLTSKHVTKYFTTEHDTFWLS